MSENTRLEVLRALAESGDLTLSQSEVHEVVQAESRTVDAALDGLLSEGVIDEHSVLGNSFYSVSPNVGKADVKQATSRQGASELAEDIIRQSRQLGDPDEGTSRGSDVFKELL